MGKLADQEAIKRMTILARRSKHRDIYNLILDKGKLCGGCGRPFCDIKGESSMHFGEKFCADCIYRFKFPNSA